MDQDWSWGLGTPGLPDGKAKRETLFLIKFYVHTLVVIVVVKAQEKLDFSVAETLERVSHASRWRADRMCRRAIS